MKRTYKIVTVQVKLVVCKVLWAKSRTAKHEPKSNRNTEACKQSKITKIVITSV